jgi:hypothetical protein
VGGGEANHASNQHATVGGGNGNSAGGMVSSVCGGGGNTAGMYSFVGGGYFNEADQYGCIGGGESNHSTQHAFVGGGTQNTAGFNSAVAGGEGNQADGGTHDFVGAGQDNMIDQCSWSVISGGKSNMAMGDYSVVPGGLQNNAEAAYAFAAGRRAKAMHDGSFVWADHTNADFSSTADDQFLIRAAGGVGIGTSSPSAELHVVGDICYTGSIAACSDARYKEQVTAITDALQTVLALRGVTYTWNREAYPDMRFDDQTHLGFIAQEMQKLLPEVVREDKDGYLSVDYGRLTPLLVESIKQQQAQIDELKALVQQLMADRPKAANPEE